jgi:AraC family transcriptional regulator
VIAVKAPAYSPNVDRISGVSPSERAIYAVADGELISAVDVAPTLLSGTERWRGFAMEVLDTPASETPPHTCLIRHLVCTIDSPTPFTFHWHENGRERTKLVVPGDHLIRSQQELRGFRWDKAARALILGIEPEMMDRIVRDIAPRGGTMLQEFYGVADDYLHALMQALASDLAHDSPTGPILGESLCTAIAVHATRRYAIYSGARDNSRGALAAGRLRLVLDYIDSRLAHELSLFELSELAGISPYYLTRTFKGQMNRSVHQYVLEQRIERAKRLLTRSNLGLAAIASAVGFRHQGHFSQVFRARVGVTPYKFRHSV